MHALRARCDAELADTKADAEANVEAARLASSSVAEEALKVRETLEETRASAAKEAARRETSRVLRRQLERAETSAASRWKTPRALSNRRRRTRAGACRDCAAMRAREATARADAADDRADAAEARATAADLRSGVWPPCAAKLRRYARGARVAGDRRDVGGGGGWRQTGARDDTKRPVPRLGIGEDAEVSRRPLALVPPAPALGETRASPRWTPRWPPRGARRSAKPRRSWIARTPPPRARAQKRNASAGKPSRRRLSRRRPRPLPRRRTCEPSE